jgi:hypothetical protein
MESDAEVNPYAGYSPEQWAYLLSQKLTAEQPKTVEAAKAIYAEVIGAAVRAERAACAALADEYAEGTINIEKHTAARSIAAKIRYTEEDRKAFSAVGGDE